MTRNAFSNQRRAVTTAAASAALLIAGVSICFGACAQQRPGSPSYGESIHARATSSEVEKAFWQCDYAVTTSGMGLGEGAWCAEISEEFKRRKFAGDFQAMLVWWQQNKAAEYRIAATQASQPPSAFQSGIVNSDITRTTTKPSKY
jgi:hypothetical protein